MADVFQFAPEGPASRGSLGASAASPTLGIRGGESSEVDDPARFLQGAAPDLSGGTSLPEFLDPLFEPKLKAEKAKRFQEGYTAALMGKSQEEINAESPWYTRIFGPVPYQLGAAKYQVDKQSADADTYFVNNLPRLRTIPTEDVVRELQGKLAEQVAGDPYTTAMLNKSFLDRLPNMIDLHTKARYVWEQEELVNGQVEAAVSVADAYSASRQAYAKLGKSAPNDVTSGYDQALLTQNLMRNLATPEFQDPASTKRYWTNLTRKLADNGNFDVLAQLMEHGISDSLEPDEVASLQRYSDTKYNEFKDKTLAADPALLERAAKISIAAAQGLGGAATVADMHAFDEDWMAHTGYKPYFEGSDYLRLGVSSSNAAIQNEAEARRAAEAATRANATEANKELSKAQTIAFARNSWLTGTAIEADNSGRPKEELDAAYVATYDALASENPHTAAQTIVVNHSRRKAPVTELARRFKASIDVTTGGAWNPAFEKAYESWKTLRQGVGMYVDPDKGSVSQIDTLAGPGAARAYFGEDNDDRLRRYEQLRSAGMPQEFAYRDSFGESPAERPQIKGDDAKETKAIMSGLKDTVDTATTGTWAGAFGTGIKPTQSGRRFVTRAIAGEYALYPNTASSAIRLKNAALGAQRRGYEFHGRANWLNPAGSDTPRISTYFGLSDDAITPAVDRAVVLGLKRVGFTVDDDSELQVLRLNDEGSNPVLLAMGQDDTGQYHVVRVGRNEIAEAIKWQREAPERNRAAIEKAQMEAARLPKL